MFERHLDFEFEVGESERHNVAFRFDQLWGPLKISVDGEAGHPEVRDVLVCGVPSGYEFSVGSNEPHQVRIEKTRKALVGGFQAQECVAYVDGQEIGRYSNAA